MSNDKKITDFTGLVAVVTGGSSGIGRGIAEALIAEGATVIVTGSNETTLTAAAAEMGATPIVADVRDAAAVQALADRVIRDFGKVDILVNNAGLGALALFDDLSIEDFHWVFDVNFWGVLHGHKSFVPLLKENPTGGYIVNVSSLAGFLPAPGATAYAASKAAMNALTEALAAELADYPIGFSILLPAPVRTAIDENSRKRPGFNENSPNSADFVPPLTRLEPDEVAAMVIHAMRTGEKFIVTHPETWPVVDARHAELRGAHERSLRS
jgi:NAD(P)-dependent dehydrogenase (short-subunit alcohol dehydrogenase family)